MTAINLLIMPILKESKLRGHIKKYLTCAVNLIENFTLDKCSFNKVHVFDHS